MRVYKKFYIIFVCLNVDTDQKKQDVKMLGKRLFVSRSRKSDF